MGIISNKMSLTILDLYHEYIAPRIFDSMLKLYEKPFSLYIEI